MHFRSWPETLRSWVLLLWALYLARIVLNGNYVYYIMPSYGFLPLVGAIVLVAIVFARRKQHKVRHVLRPEEIDGMEIPGYDYRFQFSMLTPLTIYMLPLLLAVWIYPSALAALAVEMRGLNLRPVEATPELLKDVSACKPDLKQEPRPADVRIVRANAAQNIGVRVSLDALQFIPKDRTKYPTMTPNQILLSQLVMVCCAADAYSETIVLQLPKGDTDTGGAPATQAQTQPSKPSEPPAFKPVHNKWLHATGYITLVPWGGDQLMPALVVDRPQDIKHIGKPAKPYIY